MNMMTRDSIRQLLFTSSESMGQASLQDARAQLEQLGSQMPLPAHLLMSHENLRGVHVEWLAPAQSEQRTVLYFHGGGFTMGSCNSHRGLASRLGVACRARVAVPEYRLAPEHPFPAGPDDCLAVYEALLARGIPSDQLIVAGDSAGGNLALATVLRARARGLPTPRAMVLLSPWLDLTLSGETIASRAEFDPLCSPQMLSMSRDAFVANQDPRAASSLFADLRGLPPLLIHVGTDETLLSDSLRLQQRARACGSKVDLEIGEGLWHVWHLFAPLLPEANAALASIGDFIDGTFTDNMRDCG